MALEGLSQEQIEQNENELLGRLQGNSPIGNKSLRTQLAEAGWSEDLYWEIRNRLIERGLLTKGKGKGGSVRRVPLPPAVETLPVDQDQPQPPANAPAPERDLYQPMIEVIKTRWAQDYRVDSLVAEITASQGTRQTGGKWTRPDITAASLKTFPYLPGRHFDLITFEIKPVETLDVTVVYEALGHRRAATKAYALIHIPEDNRAEFEALLDEICLEAKRFGIGVIVAANPNDYDTWEELVDAVRHDPDPQRLNDFLAQQVSQGFREQIIKWFK